jgi:hypothetical protein
MKKVIVERPRLGSRNNNDDKGQQKRFQKLAQDDGVGPKRESTSRHRRNSQKQLNEHLKPLFRFLEGKVGKFWDKVYAEIRENINTNNAVQGHILQHLEHYVEKNVIEVRKGVFTDSKGDKIYDPFFVHPKTGCLTKNEDSGYFHKYSFGGPNYGTAATPKFETVGDRTFKEIEGVWYELGLKPMPAPKPVPGKGRYYSPSFPDPPVFDKVLNTSLFEYANARKLYGGNYYATMKRQLNSKEIKKLGLVHRDQSN